MANKYKKFARKAAMTSTTFKQNYQLWPNGDKSTSWMTAFWWPSISGTQRGIAATAVTNGTSALVIIVLPLRTAESTQHLANAVNQPQRALDSTISSLISILFFFFFFQAICLIKAYARNDAADFIIVHKPAVCQRRLSAGKVTSASASANSIVGTFARC